MPDNGMNRRTAYTLYLCHALSTWNARAYEFAAIIFTASAYPGGLKAASFIGITTSIATIIFASSLGSWIDNAHSRIRTLVTTIAVNRIAATIACICWFLIVGGTSQSSFFSGGLKNLAFLAILLFGVIENLSRKANVLSLERDWVPVLAPQVLIGKSEKYDLAHVNAVISRIDIGCKLVAPIAISGFSSVVSPRTSAATIAFINLLSFTLEFWTARKIWDASPCLQKEKQNHSQLHSVDEELEYPRLSKELLVSWIDETCSAIWKWWCDYLESFKLYFSFKVWRPSLAMTTTQPSVLSVTGVLVVFLLNSGYSLKVITVAEAISTLFELSSTFVTPFAIARSVARLSPKIDVEVFEETEDRIEDQEGASLCKRNDDATKIAVTKIGFWGIFSMFVTLLPTLPIILYLTSVLPYPISPSSDDSTFLTHTFASIFLLLCLAASRLGRGIFSLSTQQLSQSQVPDSQRSRFGGTEQVFVSVFGLSHNIGSAIFSEPRQFGFLAIGSLIAIGASVIMFIWWMYLENIEIGRWGWGTWNKQVSYEAVALERIDEDSE